MLSTASAHAGLNAGAVAHLYWQTGSTTADTGRVSTSGTPKILVTATGLTSFRGAEIQLSITANSGGPLPGAWQGNGTNGCNDGTMDMRIGGTGGTYPSAFLGVPSLAIAQNREFYAENTCLTPGNAGMFWLTAAGSGGTARNPATEYGLWSILSDVRGTAAGGGTDCPGDLGDAAGPQPVTITPDFYLPCSQGALGAVLAVLDANDQIDYIPFEAGHAVLGWEAAPYVGTSSSPSLMLISPNGSNNILPGPALIATVANDDVAATSMDVALSTDGGLSYPTTLASGVTYSRFLSVTLPGTITNNARVRVTVRDADGHSAQAESQADFKIVDTVPPTVTVLSPNGGESIQGGSTYPITFNASDDRGLSDMTVEYSTSGGIGWTTAASNVAATSPYLWNVPSTATSLGRVRITVRDFGSNTATDMSDANFSITTGSGGPTSPVVSMVSPVGGEYYSAGMQVPVTFTATGTVTLTHMTVTLSTNGGHSYTIPIADSAGVRSPVWWTVPNLVSTQARIQVVVTDSLGHLGAANTANFTVTGPSPPSVTLVSPNGGEHWLSGETHNIAFTASDNVGVARIRLELSTDGGASYPLVIADSLPATSPYAWTVPVASSTTCRVRITAYDTDGNPAFDASDANFSILPSSASPPYVTVLTPNGGEVLLGGQAYNITFTATDNTGISGMTILLSTDGGSTYPTAIATHVPAISPYVWTVPSLTTSIARIRIVATDLDGNQGLDESDANFRIKDTVPPTVTVASPNGGEVLNDLQVVPILVNASDNFGLDSLKLELSTDGGATFPTLISNRPFASSNSWTVPAVSTTTARIRATVKDFEGNTASDTSDANFTIHVPAVTVAVISPNGGESWQAGSHQSLIFHYAGLGSVAYRRVTLSTDGGATFPTLVGQDAGASDSMVWTVANVSTIHARIGVTVATAAGDSAFDQSDADFSIIPIPQPFTLTVTQPNGGETLNPGASYVIRWSETPAGSGRTANISLSSDGGLHYSALAGGLPDIGAYNWTVPSTPGVAFRVQVSASDPSSSFASDASDGNFAIQNPVPTSGLNAGAVAHIYWQTGTGPGSPSTEFDGGQPQFVITVKGLKSFRGADIQLTVAPNDGGLLPDAWKGNGTGGCNDGQFDMRIGGPGGTYPNAFLGVPGLATSQNTEYLTLGSCFPGHTSAMLWLSSAGAGGVARDPSVEYGLWSVAADLRGTAAGGPTDCAGDLGDASGPRPVTIRPNYRFPCSITPLGASLALLDENDVIDYIHFTPGTDAVGWLAPPNLGLTPVAMSGLAADVAVDRVILSWKVLDPSLVTAVRVERRSDADPGTRTLATGLRPAASMSYADPDILPGHGYEYAVVATLLDGSESRAATQLRTPLAMLQLHRVQPNPSQGEMHIQYSLASAGPHRIEILGVDGRRVRRVLDGPGAAGEHQVTWDGRDEAGRTAPAGIYFVRLVTGAQIRVERAALVR